MSKLGRAEANKIAGDNIYYIDKGKIPEVQGMPELPDSKVRLTAPLFNLVRSPLLSSAGSHRSSKVDESDTTLGNIVGLLSTIFGIKTGFHSFIHNTLAQVCHNTS